MRLWINVLLVVVAGALLAVGQKQNVDADWYPIGYQGDAWKGKVEAFDNANRTLTLSHDKETFIACIPDAPYQWRRNVHNERVVDFPFDLGRKIQHYKYLAPNSVSPGAIVPGGQEPEIVIPSPPATDLITDLSPFKGRKIVVYYTHRKCNEVWRILVLDRKN